MKTLVIVLAIFSLLLLTGGGVLAVYAMGPNAWGGSGMMDWGAGQGLGAFCDGRSVQRGALSRPWCWGDTAALPSSEDGVRSIEEATQAFGRYLQRWGYGDLYLAEVMEFERNYYAIAAEEETGIGAMELLLDARTGVVSPEPGPNMMWNTKNGMHRGGMMGRQPSSGEMVLSPEEAEAIAQRWLDANLTGREAGHADPFFGYYTLHFQVDGRVEGMLSVHGRTGDVWYHSWHGEFVQMAEL